MPKCTFCSCAGHNIRSCNDQGAQDLKRDFNAIRTERELIDTMKKYTVRDLSIIMIMYGASTVSKYKDEKKLFILEEWKKRHPNIDPQEESRINQERFYERKRQQEEMRQRIQQERQLQRDAAHVEDQRLKAIATDIYNELFRRYDINIIYQRVTDGTGARIPGINGTAQVNRMFLEIMIEVCHIIIIYTLDHPNQGGMGHDINTCLRIMYHLYTHLRIPRNDRFRKEMTHYLRCVSSLYIQRPRHRGYVGDLKIQVILEQEQNQCQEEECPICMDEKERVELNCGHKFCVDCTEQTAYSRKKSFITCALCREEVKEVRVHNLGTKSRFEDQILVKKIAL